MTPGSLNLLQAGELFFNLSQALKYWFIFSSCLTGWLDLQAMVNRKTNYRARDRTKEVKKERITPRRNTNATTSMITANISTSRKLQATSGL